MTSYLNAFNIFQCRRNIFDRLDMSYERACMAIQSTIRDSGYFDSKEQVNAKIKLDELVDAIRDSE